MKPYRRAFLKPTKSQKQLECCNLELMFPVLTLNQAIPHHQMDRLILTIAMLVETRSTPVNFQKLVSSFQ